MEKLFENIIIIDAQCIKRNYLCIAGLAANVSVINALCGVALIQDIPSNP